MAQLALTYAGQAVGTYFGAMVGMPQLGGMVGGIIGSYVGGVLFPPKGQDGPKLADLTVQISSYGASIPRTWGTNRMAGNIIWATDLIPTEHEEGGKGGNSYTSTSYSCSFAIGLCEGPIEGVSRIWADGKLIYDIRPVNTGPQSSFTGTLVVYQGTELQAPDPTIQMHRDPVPAFLGLAYVVFTDLQLEKFGNRIPNLTFEVVKRGTRAMEPPSRFGDRYVTFGDTWEGDFSGDYIFRSSQQAHGGDPDRGYGDTSTRPQIQAYNCLTKELVFAVDIPASYLTGSPTPFYPINGHGACWNGRYYVGRGSPGQQRVIVPGDFCKLGDKSVLCGHPVPYIHGYSIDLTGQPLPFYDTYSSGQFQNAFYWPSTPLFVEGVKNKVFWMSSNGLGGDFGIGFDTAGNELQGTPKCECNPMLPPSEFTGEVRGSPGWAFASVFTPNGTVIHGWETSRSIYVSKVDSVGKEVLYVGEYSGVGGSTVIPMYYDPLHDVTLIGADTTIRAYPFLEVTVGTLDDRVRAMCISPTSGLLWCLVGGGFYDVPYLQLLNVETGVVVQTIMLDTFYIASDFGRMQDFPSQQKLVYIDGYSNWNIPYGTTLEPDRVYLWEIVRDISLGTGMLTEDDIDVTELVDLVTGFTIAKQGTSRSPIEQLMIAYFFDAVESEGKIKFVKLGKEPAFTIPEDDLAAHFFGQEPPSTLPLTRMDEVTLPVNMIVRYINQEADYQVGAQNSRRQIGRATSEVSYDIPVVISDQEAKAITEASLYTAWAARTKASWRTTLKYSFAEPTDVVSIDGNIIYITSKSTQDNLLTFEGAFSTGQVLTSGAVAGGISPGIGTTPIETNATTTLLLLDSPLFVDTDSTVGYYAGVSADGTPWTGAAVFKSSNAGVSYSQVASSVVSATHGSVSAALGDFSDNMFDEFNRVSVTLASGTLESVTELSVLNGANHAMLGAELLQFRNAVLTGPNTYALSGFLRGRRGSPTAGHRAGEKFILVNPALIRVTDPASDIGLARMFKGVTNGNPQVSAPSTTFADTGVSAKCLSVVQLGGGRSAAGDVFIQWVRRTRIDGQWRDSVDVPLGEASESYEIEIWNSASYITLIRTFTATTPTVTYTAAQQNTDFGSLQSAVHVRVFQMSSITGRGYPTEGSI